MDVTNVFKACVKTAKTRNRALEVNKSTTKDCLLSEQSKKPHKFTGRAKEIVNSISKLREFLEAHRKAYINSDHLSWDSSEMQDTERDQIDANVQILMRTCAQVLREFKQEFPHQSTSTQVKEHQGAVFQLIDGYLTGVCRSYSEQQAVRVKRAVDKQRLFRLESDSKRMKASPVDPPAVTSVAATPCEDQQEDSSANLGNPRFPFNDDSPTAEEMQMFEEENERIYSELSTLSDEVHQIEGQVVEISKLQEVFTSKILHQEHDLDRIADAVVGTTENIKDANEEIREAMKKNASFRVWILFFLITMAFSLLFLDWYNP